MSGVEDDHTEEISKFHQMIQVHRPTLWRFNRDELIEFGPFRKFTWNNILPKQAAELMRRMGLTDEEADIVSRNFRSELLDLTLPIETALPMETLLGTEVRSFSLNPDPYHQLRWGYQTLPRSVEEFQWSRLLPNCGQFLATVFSQPEINPPFVQNLIVYRINGIANARIPYHSTPDSDLVFIDSL